MLLSFELVIAAVVASVILFRRKPPHLSSGSPSADGRARPEVFFRPDDEPPRRHRFRNAVLAVVLMSPFALMMLLVVAWLIWSGIAFQTVTPKREALVGTWRGHDGETFVLTLDGHLSGRPNGESTPVSGTWRIGDYMGDKGVVLSIDGEGTTVLYARGSRSAPTLFFYEGDPDGNDRYEYKKQH